MEIYFRKGYEYLNLITGTKREKRMTNLSNKLQRMLSECSPRLSRDLDSFLLPYLVFVSSIRSISLFPLNNTFVRMFEFCSILVKRTPSAVTLPLLHNHFPEMNEVMSSCCLVLAELLLLLGPIFDTISENCPSRTVFRNVSD